MGLVNIYDVCNKFSVNSFWHTSVVSWDVRYKTQCCHLEKKKCTACCTEKVPFVPQTIKNVPQNLPLSTIYINTYACIFIGR